MMALKEATLSLVIVDQASCSLVFGLRTCLVLRHGERIRCGDRMIQQGRRRVCVDRLKSVMVACHEFTVDDRRV